MFKKLNDIYIKIIYYIYNSEYVKLCKKIFLIIINIYCLFHFFELTELAFIKKVDNKIDIVI